MASPNHDARLIAYLATAAVLCLALGFIFWWPLLVYVWHYWVG